jgi:hypothetical protein
MRSKVSASKKITTIAISLMITACAHNAPQSETIRICDDTGCTDRPKDYASFDPAKTLPADDPNGKIAALEELATHDPRAAYDLALRYFRGDGVKQDSYRSIKWMRDAAEKGDLNAQMALGRLYLTGLGEMGADPGEAQKWLSITASRGDQEAIMLLKEATDAHLSQQAEYRLYSRYKSIVQNSWYQGYSYRGYWGNNQWSWGNAPPLIGTHATTALGNDGYYAANSPPKAPVKAIQSIPPNTQNYKTGKNLNPNRMPSKAEPIDKKEDQLEKAEKNVAIEKTETTTTSTAEQSNLTTNDFGKYYALVIGNNKYQYVPELDTAENDAKEVAQVLKDYYGFNTKVLLNAKRKDILDAINEFKLKLNANDNLVIYYAGHGVKDVSAYWLPVDARQDSSTEWIQAETITTELKKINSNHILIISDSCYSGELSRSINPTYKQGSRDYYLKKLLSKKSRTLIASGGNEPVTDAGGGNHSVFTKAFIEALKNAQDSVFTDDELFNKDIKEIVAGNAEQTPQYSALKNSGHEDGSFIFVKKK